MRDVCSRTDLYDNGVTTEFERSLSSNAIMVICSIPYAFFAIERGSHGV